MKKNSIVLSCLLFSFASAGQYKLKDIPYPLSEINKTDFKGRQGVWFFYDRKDSTVSSFKNFANDTLHGYFENYWPNGKISEKGFYKNGLLDSIYIGYWENGEKRGELFYKDGKLHGVIKYFDKTGTKFSQENYNYGLVDSAFEQRIEPKVDTVVIHYPSKWNKRYRIFQNETLLKEIDFYKDRVAIESLYSASILQSRSVYSTKKPFLLKKKYLYKDGELYKTYYYNRKGELIKTD